MLASSDASSSSAIAFSSAITASASIAILSRRDVLPVLPEQALYVAPERNDRYPRRRIARHAEHDARQQPFPGPATTDLNGGRSGVSSSEIRSRAEAFVVIGMRRNVPIVTYPDEGQALVAEWIGKAGSEEIVCRRSDEGGLGCLLVQRAPPICRLLSSRWSIRAIAGASSGRCPAALVAAFRVSSSHVS